MTLWMGWVIGGLILCAAELLSMAFVVLFLGLAGLLAGGSAALGLGLEGSLAVFVLASALGLLGIRPLAVRKVRASPVPTNAQALIGMTGYVSEPIDPLKGGRVRLGGDDWAARADQPLNKETPVIVESIEGVTLTVRRAEL